MPKKIHGLMLLAVVVLAGAANSLLLAQQPSDTLHERAKRAGGKFVWRYRANRSLIYPNIEELAKRSDLVVVGRTLGHRPSMRPDEKFITNDFLVRVQEVIKGDLPNGRSIIVSLPGGAHRFSDGTYAAVMPIGHKEAEDRGIYVFFLKSKKKGSVFKGHKLASETQGLFAVKDGKVEPADLVADDPVVTKYRGMGVATFLAQIHGAVPRKKK